MRNEALTLPRLAAVLAGLHDRGGSRFTDIQKAVTSQTGRKPHFLELKSLLTQGLKAGLFSRNASGRFKVNKVDLNAAVESDSSEENADGIARVDLDEGYTHRRRRARRSRSRRRRRRRGGRRRRRRSRGSRRRGRKGRRRRR